MSDTPILELREASKSFGAVQALYEVDFRVHPGEVMALVGDNGAGKSTLIKGIAGINPFDSGEVLFERRAGVDQQPEGRGRAGHRGRLPGPRAGRQPRRRPEHVPGPRAPDGHPARARRDDHGAARERDAGHAVRDHDPLGAPDGGQPVRRPAPVGGGGQGRDVELQARDPRRADRRPGRRPDPAGARPGQAPRRPGPRGGAGLAQPARRLRGRGHDHRAAPGPERGRVQARRRDPDPGGRGDHRGQALQGPRRPRRR